MFNKNSGLVQLWSFAVLNGTYKYEQVPNLSNLKSQVDLVLTDMGYQVPEGA